MDGQAGYNCSIFRNESARRSSEIVLEAERHAVEKWGLNRMYTYIDPRKIKSQPRQAPAGGQSDDKDRETQAEALLRLASSATLYEIGFNHFFRGPDTPGGGDQVYFQGHASPGIYARSFLEGCRSRAQRAHTK